MNETRHYDAAIIGSGQGGKPLATAMAAAGYIVPLLECRRRDAQLVGFL